MKKLYGFILLFAAVLLLSGCTMKMSTGLDISKDGEVTAKIVAAYDDEMLDAMINMGSGDSDLSGDTTDTEQKKHTDKERWDYLETSTKENDSYDGFEQEKYEKDGFKGYTFTKKMGKIDDLIADKKDEKTAMDSFGKDAKIFIKEGNVYKLNVKNSEENDPETMKQYESMGAAIDMKFEVTLPNKAKSNNATKVEGNTYTWDLLKTQDIKLEFELGGSSNLLPIIIGAAAAVVVIGVVAVVLVKGKKNKKEDPVVESKE